MPPLTEPTAEKLAVGAVAILHIERYGTDSPRHRTFIRGWEEGTCVILDVPRHRGTPVRLQPHDHCVIRFFSCGDACGFDASVREASVKTFPFLYVSWPECVDITQVRRHQRIELALPCTALTEAGERTSGQIHDLSAGGCRIASRLPIEDESLVRLSFSLPDGCRIEDLPAVVRVCRANGDGFVCGCEFKPGASALRDIEFFVATRINQGRVENHSQRPVLVLESDAARRTRLCGEFEELGFPVFGAPSVVDAAYRLRASVPGVLLINMEQPGCTAFDVCRWVRHAPGAANVPILVYGGDDSRAAEQAARDAGASVLLPHSTETGPVIRAAIRLLNT
jgi:CheY-like chemotaxis protein/c-di-GMP-binding flagellar brake protein YcgR